MTIHTWDGDEAAVYQFINEHYGTSYCSDWVEVLPDGSLFLMSDEPSILERGEKFGFAANGRLVTNKRFL